MKPHQIPLNICLFVLKGKTFQKNPYQQWQTAREWVAFSNGLCAAAAAEEKAAPVCFGVRSAAA